MRDISRGLVGERHKIPMLSLAQRYWHEVGLFPYSIRSILQEHTMNTAYETHLATVEPTIQEIGCAASSSHSQQK